ncbi:MAG: hypothetical protein AAGJ37_06315 [Pseudomonadota bacterium]
MMRIPSHIVRVNPVVKPKKKESVSLDKSDTDTDVTKQDVEREMIVEEKRKGKDRRKRNTKPLFDTRSGRDRRNDPDKPSIDTKA